MSKELEEDILKSMSKEEKFKYKKSLKKKIKKQKNKQNDKEATSKSENEQKQQILQKLQQIEQENSQKEDKNIEETEQINVLVEEQDQVQIDQEVQENKDYQILTGKYYEEFKDIFDKFDSLGDRQLERQLQGSVQQKEEIQQPETEQKDTQQENKQAEQTQDQQKESRKKRKAQRWLKVAKLKSLVKRPELVEAWDITAPDPLLLVQLKSLRNTVPVPAHWSQKRKYLQNKRGILKQPFQLPSYIEKTGIAKLRDPFADRDGVTMVKQKLRDRMNPKLGKIDIDYEVLHDAFFKYATKPELSKFGDMYHEGKEQNVKQSKYVPGKMSEELRQALGCGDFTPPPWLINMQRYGPPPAFPNLKIVGITADSGPNSYSFVSRQHNFEEAQKQIQIPGQYASYQLDEEDEDDEKVEKIYWGGLIEEDEEEEEEEEFEEQMQEEEIPQPDFGDEMEKYQQDELAKPGLDGIETPDVDLRNNKPSVKGERDDQFKYSGGIEDSQPQAPLFQILEPTKTNNMGSNNIFGSTGQNSYIIPDKKY